MSPHDKRDSNLCNAQVMSPYEVNEILDIVSEDSDATEQWWNELEENIAKSFDGENINRNGARHKTLLDTDKDSSTGGHVDGPGKPHCSGYGGHVDGPGKPHCSGTGGQVDGPGKPHCSSCDQVERFWIGDEDIWARRETQQDSWKDKDEHDNQIYDHEPHHIASIVRGHNETILTTTPQHDSAETPHHEMRASGREDAPSKQRAGHIRPGFVGNRQNHLTGNIQHVGTNFDAFLGAASLGPTPEE